jgi:LuxR family quorum sensing-dependent transcriptional regulator
MNDTRLSKNVMITNNATVREARWRQGVTTSREAADVEQNALSAEFLPTLVAFGLTNATLIHATIADNAAVRRSLFGKSSSGWEKLYLERMHHLADPAISEMLRSPETFFWSELPARRGRLTSAENRVLRDAAKFGFREGFVVSQRVSEGVVRGLVFYGAGPVADLCEARLTLSSAAEQIFQRLLAGGAPLGSRPRKCLALRSRQIECLHWAALGKTSTEIGMILSLSRKTVDEHIENACRKFGVNGRIQAVARAVDIGLIELR